MNSVSTPGSQKCPVGPRPAFVFALLGSLGVALVGLQTIEPVRQAFGLDPIIRPPVQTAVQTAGVAPAVDAPATLRFDRLSSAPGVERPVQPVPTRRLGSGTRRAVRLAPAVVQMASARTSSSPAVSVWPVVAAVPAQPRPTQRPDSARRDDAVLGPVQYAKLDDALRRVVDGDAAAPIRVIVQTQPGQQETTAQWLTTSGREVHHLHPSLDGLTATLLAADVAALNGDPSIARLSIDAVVTATGTEAIYTSDVVAAIEHATANKDALDIDVMNLSLGHPIYDRAADDPLVQAVERAVDAGLSGVTGGSGEICQGSWSTAPASSRPATDTEEELM